MISKEENLVALSPPAFEARAILFQLGRGLRFGIGVALIIVSLVGGI